MELIFLIRMHSSRKQLTNKTMFTLFMKFVNLKLVQNK